jgi:hypothetical protein
VTYDAVGAVTRTDSYSITNKQSIDVVFFPINLPLDATNIVVRDQFGRTLTVNVFTSTNAKVANSTFILSLSENQSTLLSVSYNLPKSTTGQSGQISSTLFPPADYYIQSASVTYTLPEGAHFTYPTSSLPGYSLSRSVFQETLTVTKQGVSSLDLNIPSEGTAQFSYNYNYLWTAFRPTIWVAAIVAVALIILALVVYRRKIKAQPAAPVTPRTAVPRPIKGATASAEDVQQFIEAYEEKNRITQDMRTLEARAEHGRIPRRRYKVQKQMFETRLEALSSKTANLKEVLRASGGSYADIVRQLDAAEVELSEVNMTIKNVTVQNETGQISLENYRKQLENLERRKEKAETTVNGLLLRLRGEIR